MSGPAYEVDLRALHEFAAGDLYAMLKMRVDVFVVEQACAYPELDGKDADAQHLRLLESGDLLGSARILPPTSDVGPASIGRVVVSPAHRGRRLGDSLMAEAIAACERLHPDRPIALAAQSHLRRFYASFGFVPISDEYLEDDIPHINMQRPVSADATDGRV